VGRERQRHSGEGSLREDAVASAAAVMMGATPLELNAA
jgi:hypothetical protein